MKQKLEGVYILHNFLTKLIFIKKFIKKKKLLIN